MPASIAHGGCMIKHACLRFGQCWLPEFSWNPMTGTKATTSGNLELEPEFYHVVRHPENALLHFKLPKKRSSEHRVISSSCQKVLRLGRSAQVYCSPNLSTARWYARPQILFGRQLREFLQYRRDQSHNCEIRRQSISQSDFRATGKHGEADPKSAVWISGAFCECYILKG